MPNSVLLYYCMLLATDIILISWQTMALPLRDRVLVGNNNSSFSTLSKVGPVRPMRYDDWSQEGMKAAMKAVEGGMSIQQATEKHNIPKITLGDRISRKLLPAIIYIDFVVSGICRKHSKK